MTERPVTASEVRQAVKGALVWAWDYEGRGATFEFGDDVTGDALKQAFHESHAHLLEAERWNADNKAAERRAYRAEWFRGREARDPGYRLNRRIGKQIHACLNGANRGRKWEALVGYTLEDLRAHLEARFTDGMTWESAGRWHIDHERPLSSFTIAGPDCPEFRKAWALENLQPLWGPDNLRKGARWDG